MQVINCVLRLWRFSLEAATCISILLALHSGMWMWHQVRWLITLFKLLVTILFQLSLCEQLSHIHCSWSCSLRRIISFQFQYILHMQSTCHIGSCITEILTHTNSFICILVLTLFRTSLCVLPWWRMGSPCSWWSKAIWTAHFIRSFSRAQLASNSQQERHISVCLILRTCCYPNNINLIEPLLV